MPEPTTVRIHAGIHYGCGTLGRLRSVLLHTPGESLERVNAVNCHRWLFDTAPDPKRFREEHCRYGDLLRSLGVEVFELAEQVRERRDLLPFLPNLTYLHDVAVISDNGAILSRMARRGRMGEELVVREALERLGIPIIIDFEGNGHAFEGCLLISPETVLVAHTERHAAESIRAFIPAALRYFREIIVADIPRARRFMHPDTVFNRIRPDLALAHLPSFRDVRLYRNGYVGSVDFFDFLRHKGVEIIPVSDAEQRRLACSFVPLESGVMIHYDTALSPETRRLLSRKGVEFFFFHPDALKAGGGSLRCLTLRLHREQGE